MLAFALLPKVLGTAGLWLAVPAAELITVAFSLLFLRRTTIS